MTDASRRIVEIRATLDMSQADFAEALGVDRRTVGRWERGENEPKYRDVQAAEDLLKKASSRKKSNKR